MRKNKIPLLLTIIALLLLGVYFIVNSVMFYNDFQSRLHERFGDKDISQIEYEDFQSLHTEVAKDYVSYIPFDPFLQYGSLIIIIISLIWSFVEINLEINNYDEVEDKKLIIYSFIIGTSLVIWIIESSTFSPLFDGILISISFLSCFIFLFIKTDREKYKEKRSIQAQNLSTDEYHNIHTLAKKKYLLARATGETITKIHAEIKNRVNRKLNIFIPHGTYFIARGGHQNMVTRKEYKFTLYPDQTENISVPASCINASLPIPSKESKFRGVSLVSENLCRFLKEAEGEDEMTIQAGVWAITDNFSRSSIKSKLIARDYYGNQRSAISDNNIDKAKQILEKLGIPNFI